MNIKLNKILKILENTRVEYYSYKSKYVFQLNSNDIVYLKHNNKNDFVLFFSNHYSKFQLKFTGKKINKFGNKILNDNFKLN